jgi:hypothetical protein
MKVRIGIMKVRIGVRGNALTSEFINEGVTREGP